MIFGNAALMAKKLKTYITSLGFFDLAVAAPSMKAALEAWGSGRNLFHQGFAEETDDAEIVTATLAKPGIVLKRAVGSKGAFSENSELPKSLPVDRPKDATARKTKSKPIKAQKSKSSAKNLNLEDARAAKQAAAALEKERARREAEI